MVGVIETAHGLAILLDEIISGKAEEQRLPLGHEAQKFARMYDANWLVAQLKAIYQTAAGRGARRDPDRAHRSRFNAARRM